ncbi:MAG TPA: hypothetical protein VFM05_12080, partial [Candidatus Saccharimonadales bacterium]|nr:hypothetical protein [Candidatus Saccharimonadales bacterium]
VFTDGDQKNLITNPSFENGLWQEKVNDCNNYDFESTADIKMRQADQSATEGSHSLELSSSRHDACTYTNLHVDGGDYLFSFDYQSPNAQTASFYLAHDKEDSVLAKGSQTILDDAWHTFRGLVSVPGKGGKAKLYFYAKEQFGVNAINRYDNVSLVRVEALKRIRVPGLASQYEKVGLPKGQTYDFSIQGTGQTFKNLIPNASFEQGAWQKNVSDCRNYDSKGHIAQRINSTDKTDGKQSLVLESVRHDACVRSTININATTKYDLSFDYKGKKGHHYGYAVSYDDPEHTLSRQQLEIKKGDSWQRANIRLQSPARATTATIYLYAFEPANKTPNTILYDNVSLTEQPDFASRFYIVEEPIQTLHVPERTVATQEQEGKKIIRIRGATTPFFLQVSETYHEKWRLMLDNSHTNSGLAGINPSAIGPEAVKHFKLSNYMNSWLVDPKALCEGQGGLRQGCVKQANNTYDIALVAEFTPGRWFGIASTISWATLLGCLLYLAASHGREMPTYQLLSYREWRGIVRRWK